MLVSNDLTVTDFWGDEYDGPKNKPVPVSQGADSQISSKYSTSEDLMAANG